MTSGRATPTACAGVSVTAMAVDWDKVKTRFGRRVYLMHRAAAQ